MSLFTYLLYQTTNLRRISWIFILSIAFLWYFFKFSPFADVARFSHALLFFCFQLTSYKLDLKDFLLQHPIDPCLSITARSFTKLIRFFNNFQNKSKLFKDSYTWNWQYTKTAIDDVSSDNIFKINCNYIAPTCNSRYTLVVNFNATTAFKSKHGAPISLNICFKSLKHIIYKI